MSRHRFDPFSFVTGLALAVFGLLFLTGSRTPADLGAAWVWPALLLVPGLLLVLYGIRRAREREPGEAGKGASGTEEPEPDG